MIRFKDGKVEEWRPLVGCEQRYEVSSLGNVRSLVRPCANGSAPRAIPLMLKPQKAAYGYLKIFVRNLDGVKKNIRINIAVLEAFVGPRPDGFVCGHLDGNPANNTLTNLAWVSPSENNEHQRIHGTMSCGERRHNAKLTDAIVSDIRAAYKSGTQQNVLSRMYGVHFGTINKVVNGKSWKHVP